MQGTGIGMIYDKTSDALTMLDQAVVHIAADEHGAGAAEVTSAPPRSRDATRSCGSSGNVRDSARAGR